MKLEQANIQERLESLARQPWAGRVFGAGGHRFVLNPPLDVNTIADFEKSHGVEFPEDYRYFISQIGNGGAGPAYGLFQFGKAEDEQTWESVPLGELNQPFPYSSTWNLDESFWEQNQLEIPDGISREEEQRIWKTRDDVLYENYWKPAITCGAIPIADLGCGLSQWLVVCGDQQGYVWNDHRADERGLIPLVDESGRQMTFTDWYLHWLERSERGEGLLPNPKVRWQSSSQNSTWKDFLVLFALIVIGVLFGLAKAFF